MRPVRPTAREPKIPHATSRSRHRTRARRIRAPRRRRTAPHLRRPGTNLDDLLLSVGREAGILLYLLATGAQSRRILELGTSYGYSTVWLAAAARTTGGKVLSLELQGIQDRACAPGADARRPVEHASSSTPATASTSLQTLPGPFDFVLLDVWKDLYLPCFELVHPKLAPGGIIAADNMLLPESARPHADAYRARVRAGGRHGFGADRSRQRHRDQPQALSCPH